MLLEYFFPYTSSEARCRFKVCMQKGFCISRWKNKVSATRCFAVRGNRQNHSRVCITDGFMWWRAASWASWRAPPPASPRRPRRCASSTSPSRSPSLSSEPMRAPSTAASRGRHRRSLRRWQPRGSSCATPRPRRARWAALPTSPPFPRPYPPPRRVRVHVGHHPLPAPRRRSTRPPPQTPRLSTLPPCAACRRRCRAGYAAAVRIEPSYHRFC